VVSTDFAKVIRRLNERFRTSFREFEKTGETLPADMRSLWRTREVHQVTTIDTMVARQSEQLGTRKTRYE
jgi:hypothetical protein